ncbi:DUF1127 domain-containing protein [Mesorhizobium sp. CA13]|uniref:DUF1127 domain-containing protein n=1 Tax=Mesorhizobium sp. CA13 TaxID=2876643 RepID=UPI001CCB4EC3|nr:DUF1127 domain-containing protein [Mesorhizobium sp. CA13]MBZ9854940.1 DUF1127 domain-containing protein [Mesorhizobium sp. CA13]
MTTGHTEPDLIVNRSVSSRLVTVATELCLSVLRAITRIIRIRRDRARLCELPDYLLRDIGINRSEIQSITWFGDRDISRRRSKTVDRPGKRC